VPLAQKREGAKKASDKENISREGAKKCFTRTALRN
jgi:hypothetical protein